MHPYVLLAAAVVCEVVATCFLKASEGLTRPWPTLVVVAGSVGSFYLLSLVLRTVPARLAYAVWCGLGIVLTTAVAWLAFGQRLNAPTMAGMVLILAGAVVIHMASQEQAV